MAIRDRFAIALAAGRAAVADVAPPTRAFATLDPAVSPEDARTRLARLKPASAGQRTLFLVGSDELAFYRIDGVVTEYLPSRGLDIASAEPGEALRQDLYTARRLRLFCAKWEVGLIQALDAATAARLAFLRTLHGGEVFKVEVVAV